MAQAEHFDDIFQTEWLAQLFGHLVGSDMPTVFDELRHPPSDIHVLKAAVKQGEHECIVVKGTNARGTFTLWIAPHLDYSVVRLRREMKATDSWGDGKLSDLPQVSESLRSRSPYLSLARQAQVTELIVESHSRVDGRWIPVRAKHSHNIDFGEGRSVTSTATITLTQIDLEPKFPPHHFVPDFPDGVPAFKMDELQIVYIWLNRELVPAVDQPTIRQIDRDVERKAVRVY